MEKTIKTISKLIWKHVTVHQSQFYINILNVKKITTTGIYLWLDSTRLSEAFVQFGKVFCRISRIFWLVHEIDPLFSRFFYLFIFILDMFCYALKLTLRLFKASGTILRGLLCRVYTNLAELFPVLSLIQMEAI